MEDQGVVALNLDEGGREQEGGLAHDGGAGRADTVMAAGDVGTACVNWRGETRLPLWGVVGVTVATMTDSTPPT